MTQVLVGADPELFLTDMNSKRFISSIGKFGGTKHKPKSIGSGCLIQEDNVAVEFNIPPSKSEEEFVKHIEYSLATLADRARKMDLNLSFTATANFDDDQLEHPKAKEFGCEPDYNAWTQMRNPRPKAIDYSLRSCGGHIHVGCHEFDPFEMARTMDLFLGVPSITLDPNSKRRELYGQAGACRRKPYGVEYRVLSNFWLRTHAEIAWVFKQTQRSIEFLRIGNRLNVDDGIMIQESINTSNISLANKLMEKYDELGINLL